LFTFEVSYVNVLFQQICGGTPLLLLLNKDAWMLSALSRRNRLAPVVSAAVLTLYLVALFDCGLFTSSRLLTRIVGFFELLVLAASTPVAACLLTILWADVAYGLEILVVFTAPAYLVLFLLGTEYSSWFLAACGLAASYWLMKYKLQFGDDR
jgi:hypothetical protein